MAWSYNLASGNTRDTVRLLIGDTDSADPQLQDEEIDYFVTEQVDARLAAAACCRALSAKFTRQVDTTNLSLSVSASQRAQAYRDLAQELTEQAASSGGGAEMFAGGLSIAGKEALDEDTDAVQPNFRVGQDDLPGA